MARAKKHARRRGETIVFVDESGLSERPCRDRTWAPRGQTPVQKDVVAVGFRPDNLRMSLDGSVIFAAGHGNYRTPEETSNVARIDPETLEVRRIFGHAAMDGFVASTTATRIGNEMWLGSYRGDRIAYFPVPE